MVAEWCRTRAGLAPGRYWIGIGQVRCSCNGTGVVPDGHSVGFGVCWSDSGVALEGAVGLCWTGVGRQSGRCWSGVGQVRWYLSDIGLPLDGYLVDPGVLDWHWIVNCCCPGAVLVLHWYCMHCIGTGLALY